MNNFGCTQAESNHSKLVSIRTEVANFRIIITVMKFEVHTQTEWDLQLGLFKWLN